VTYSAALTHGFTAATILDDSPVSFPLSDGRTYSPVNYDSRFHGRIPLRIAFANSFNIPAVKTVNSVGVDTFISLAKKMGISTLNNNGQYGLSITLGGMDTTMLDMATIYATSANLGQRVDLDPILKITDNNGSVLEEKHVTKTRVLPEAVSFIINNILSDNKARLIEFGPNSPLVIPDHTVSVKTGTSDDKRDNWTIGFRTSDPKFLVTVWVGNNDNSPMSQTLASGITGAAPIWHNIITQLLNNTPDEILATPSGVITKKCSYGTEYFVEGTENSVNCATVFPTWTPTPLPH
ncbi:MAG: hypothetical protein KGJ07_09560, partial [Patescibacteria group bacterium]|nr:hypothetical protein [Patescibacteria group bacterium]